MRSGLPLQRASIGRNTARTIRHAALRGVEALERRTLLANIVVNTTLDNAVAGDGLTTLREAITAANATPSVVDAISFNLGSGAREIYLGSALPELRTPVSIQGPGANLLTVCRSSGNPFRVFTSSSNVSLSDMTVAYGLADTGGGIYSRSGSLSVHRCVVFGNTADGAGGGIRSDGTLVITDSTITGNYARWAAGLDVWTGPASVQNSTIDNNSAWGDGGGVIIENASATFVNSTIANNFGGHHGGGFTHHGPSSLVLQNCTVTGNTALFGSGLWLDFFYGGAPNVKLFNTILAANTSGVDVAGGAAIDSASAYNVIGTGSNLTNGNGNVVGVTPQQLALGSLSDNGGPTRTIALLPESIGINRGDPNFTAPPAFDQRGAPHARKIGPRVDVGAFESDVLNARPSAGAIGLVAVPLGTAGSTLNLRDAFDDAEDGPAALVYTVVGNTNPALISTASIDDPTDVLTLGYAPGVEGAAAITIRATDPGGRFVEQTVDVAVLTPRFVVTAAGDELLPGDGLTTLREAVIAANFDGDADTITFDLGPGFQVIGLSRPLPELSTNISIQGPGAGLLNVRRIGPDEFRIFTTSGDVSLSDMTITDGVADTGGGIYARGGTLSIRRCTITGNSARDTGGGIRNHGILVMSDSTISGNYAPGGGGAMWNEADAAATVVDSEFTHNSGGEGGAIANRDRAGLTVRGCDFFNNATSAWGGGLFNNFGFVTVTDSTFVGNSANFDGGGINTNDGVVVVEGSTFWENRAHRGGALYNHFGGELRVINSTVYRNGGNIGAGIFSYARLELYHTTVAENWVLSSAIGPAVFNESGSVLLYSSVVARNAAGDVSAADPSITYRFSFIGDVNGDPMLDVLADNGGPTWTLRVLPGSPLINAGDPDFAGSPAFDQRGEGFNRVIGGRVDVGAFEYNAMPTTAGLADLTVPEDSPDSVVALRDVFDDLEDGRDGLTYAVVGNSNPGLFASAAIDNAADELTLDYAADAHGVATITVRATDRNGGYVETTFDVTVLSARQQAELIAQRVRELPGLNHGNRTALLAKLNLNGNAAGDVDKIQSFIGTVESFAAAGKISAADAADLIAAAGLVLVSLG